MSLHFFARREVWCPTLLGWAILAIFFAFPCLWWINYGESFLSVTRRFPAQVLVVEGWIGAEGIRAAKLEFEANHYDFILTSGGNPDPHSEENWQRAGWTYAEGAQKQLIRLGVPAEKVIAAPAQETERQRTYASALAVKAALDISGIRAKSINIFTIGAHARRSQLVYEKAYGPETEIGVIAWEPPGYASTQWWHSSERAIDLLIQTVGFFYEFLLNSGRRA